MVDSLPMRIPIPAVVVPLIALLLYTLVPGVREHPWTAVRIAGAIVAVIAYALVFAARNRTLSSQHISNQGFSEAVSRDDSRLVIQSGGPGGRTLARPFHREAMAV